MGPKQIALVVLALMLLPVGAAHADTEVLYPGSRCVAVAKDGATIDITVEAISAIVSVSDLADANADAELLRRCVGALSDCRAKDKPDPGWLIATKWGAIGMAVGGAFVLGLML